MPSSIRSRSERWWLSIPLLVLWGLAPLNAAGAEISDEAKTQARVKYSDGNAAYERGDYRNALASFNAAYQLAPLPGFLFNVGQCHRQLGAFEKAASFYRSYLALSENEPANAGMVKELIAEMDSKAKQEAARRATKEKTVMQAKAAEKDRPEALPAKAAGASKPERSGLKEAERKALDIRTSRALAAKPKSLPPGAVPGAPRPEQSRESLTSKWWVWAGAGAAVLLAGGIVYAVTAPDQRPTTLGTFPTR
ncbi:tetratricopeptide repeat protein [Hyalangium versicolor]|uniref:tetratricopeptide repeat protein n=1 Tax=Hyalangium versicolor TaxID=2861190 RepID=UPI001CCF18B6|nr:tetratricopeptide repeat protein [Hyalangium versicolor]